MENKWPLFEVPVIAPDLRQEETVIQIADTLDYLSKVVDTVFDCINTRISQNKEKLIDLQRRTSACKDKVEKLSGSKKATQIFSSSKYPASDVHKDFVSIFSGVPKLEFTASTNKIGSKQVPVEEKSLEEKLQFYHVKTGGKDVKRSYNFGLEEGLGKLPSEIESVSSLLLFNTSENPYKRYVTLDPMGVISKTRKAVLDEPPNEMEAAPLSISRQEQLDTQVKETYFYSPSLGDVPNIDVPLDLPDLPGIADDLRYSLDLGPGFAPSVTTTPAIPDLPNIPEETPFISKPENEVIQPLSQSSVAAPPAPPPPPPPPAPPPPPPPPPPPAEPVAPVSPTVKPSKPAVISATSDDARANLMAAIRNAGGSGKAKLRSVQEGKDEIRRIKEEKVIASGGDLMADLHNKLLMRRKGISGDAKKEGLSVGSAMDKVSAMIPPPPQHQDTSSATEDDDWEE